MVNTNSTSVLHIRYAGRSFDLPLADLDLGPLSTDAEVKRALSGYLDVAESNFRDYVVDRHNTGNMTLRPEAVFG